MFNRKYVQEYVRLIGRDPTTYAKDYCGYIQDIANSTAIYKGEPVPALYQGIFYDEATFGIWSKIASTMISISNKMTEKYLEDAEFRKKFGFPELMERLILHDPGYGIHIPMARFDIFYNGPDDFWFCECNTDGSSAMNEDNVLGQLLLQRKGMQAFAKQYQLINRDYFDPWVEKSLALYESIKGDNPKTLAIADFTESGTPYEFLEFQKRYEAKGIETLIVDLRDLRYENGRLRYGESPIDMVYRRVTTAELVEKAEEALPFIEAYFDNAFVCIGSMRSQIIHNKLAFAILHEESSFLTEEEIRFVENHIPMTGSLTKEKIQEIVKEKDRYIVKPSDSRGSEGVYVGRDYSAEEYGKILSDLAKAPAIYQTFIDADPMDFVFFDEEGKFRIESFVPLMGMFIYMEEFQGIYTRVGAEHIISGRTSYFVAPNLEVKEWPKQEF